MTFEDNPADERYELDLCIQEINKLTAERNAVQLERDALRPQLAAMQSATVEEVEKILDDSCRESMIVTQERLATLARNAIRQRDEVVGLLVWLVNIRGVKGCFEWISANKNATRILEIVAASDGKSESEVGA